MAEHAAEDRADSEGTLRASGHVSEHVPDAPLGAQRRGVPLLVVQRGEPLGQIEHFVTFCVPYVHVNPARCRYICR